MPAPRSRVLWTFVAFLLASGGAWLVVLVTTSSRVMLDRVMLGTYTPHLGGAALAGLTIARATHVPRRTRIAIATSGVLAWVGLQSILHLVRDAQPAWVVPLSLSPVQHYAVLATISTALAAAGASVRFGGPRRDSRVLWIWISGLITFGAMISLLLVAHDRRMTAVTTILLVAAPVLAGALTQVLAPYRRIWTCGGGAMLLVLIALDHQTQSPRAAGDFVGALFGIGLFALLGAAGARIAWRVFRNNDPREPPTSPGAPVATTSLRD